MEGVRWADLWLNAERVIWVVDHPVRHGWPRRQGEGDVVAPRDVRWSSDTNERVIPGCARSWCGNATINGGLHRIGKMQARHRRVTCQHARWGEREHALGSNFAPQMCVEQEASEAGMPPSGDELFDFSSNR